MTDDVEIRDESWLRAWAENSVEGRSLLRLLVEARVEADNLAKNLVKLQGDYNVATAPPGASAMERANSVFIWDADTRKNIARAIEAAYREATAVEQQRIIKIVEQYADCPMGGDEQETQAAF